MRPPDPNRFTSYSTYFWSLQCFLVGYAAITVFSLGRVTQDERDGHGLNPMTRLPDGRIGLSEFAIGTIRLIVQGLACAAFIGLAWLWLHYR
jgi:hypothetical protein